MNLYSIFTNFFLLFILHYLEVVVVIVSYGKRLHYLVRSATKCKVWTGRIFLCTNSVNYLLIVNLISLRQFNRVKLHTGVNVLVHQLPDAIFLACHTFFVRLCQAL